MPSNDLRYFDLGDVNLLHGGTLANAHIAYQTYGTLNAVRDNCVVLPTYYTGTHSSYEFFRKQLYRSLGCGDIEQFMTVWEEDHLGWDACDLLAMLWTWEHADLGQIP